MEEKVDVEALLMDMLSRDKTRVWRASCTIISLGQQPEHFPVLIEHLPQILKKTRWLNLGGALAPKQRFLDYAVKTIEFHRDSTECPCALYTGHTGFDPRKEDGRKHITLLETVTLDGGYPDYHRVQCKRCGQRFKALEREYHFTWWKWEKEPAENQ